MILWALAVGQRLKKNDRCIEEGVKLSKVTLNISDKAGKMKNELLVELQSKSSSKVAETEHTIDRPQNSINQIQQRIEAKENIALLRGGGSLRVNYTALNSGRIDNNDQNDSVNIDSLKDQLKIEEENVQTGRNNIHQYQNEGNNIRSDFN